jgi:acetyl-CoA carboxylase biotin carboxyl carrier protein
MNDNILIEVQRLCRLVHEHDLRELALSRPDFSLALTSVQQGTPLIAGTALPMQAAPQPAPTVPTPAPPTGHAVTSPIIGIFYRTASPDAPPLVEIGDTVEVGQVVGIVEAMKVFNEITTDIAGRVIALPVPHGALVQVDQPLVILEP